MSEMTSALGISRKRALGYGRVSTRRQAEHAVSLEEQQARIVSCCEAREADLVKTFVDRGLTGKIDGRPEFQRMIEFVEDPNNRIELVIVYSMSRFFRNIRHYLNYKERLTSVGMKLIAATQEIPDGPTGALMETIIAAVDGHQSDCQRRYRPRRHGRQCRGWLLEWISPSIRLYNSRRLRAGPEAQEKTRHP